MLLVRTRLGVSPVHGLGLFADEFVPAGKRVWELTKGLDLEMVPSFVDALPEPMQSSVRHYAYLDVLTNLYVLCGDDGRFCNHSDVPNLRADARDYTYAIRDIQRGEELVCNYREFDLTFIERGI